MQTSTHKTLKKGQSGALKLPHTQGSGRWSHHFGVLFTA